MRTLLIIVVAALSPAATGSELRFQCPERYLSRVTELTEVPMGWPGAVVTVRPALSLLDGGVVGASPKLDPPAELHGDTTKVRGGWSETRYPIGPDGESWAYCAYGVGGEIQLYRRVDGEGRRMCTVRSLQMTSSKPKKVEIVCK